MTPIIKNPERLNDIKEGDRLLYSFWKNGRHQTKEVVFIRWTVDQYRNPTDIALVSVEGNVTQSRVNKKFLTVLKEEVV